MHVEVSVALNFMISYLYNKLPRRRVDMFGEELEKGLKKKFEGHWYPEKPFKGSAYRCIRVGGEKIDPVLIYAAQESGLNMDEIKDYLPKELTLWIDPCEVSYRIGEKGVVKILFSEKRGPLIPLCHGSGSNSDDDAFESLDKEIQAASKGFNPEAQSFKPIDSLSSSLTNLSISPSSPTPSSGWSTTSTSPVAGLYKSSSPVNTFLPPKPHQSPSFTAATFAATKFGSTKLKSQAKRPSRLSPTEIGAYIKQRSTPLTHGPAPVPFGGHQPPQHQHHTPRPRTHSPREHRPDFLEHQRMLYLQQQQQQQLQHHQQQQHTAALLSPLGGSVSDILSHQSQQPMGFSDLLQAPGRAAVVQGMPSPDGGNKAFMDGFSMNTLPPYTNQLQHLLVAN